MNFIINSQDKIKNILKSLHDKESLAVVMASYKKILAVKCCPGILYGQAKVLRPVINTCSSFRPIIYAHYIS